MLMRLGGPSPVLALQLLQPGRGGDVIRRGVKLEPMGAIRSPTGAPQDLRDCVGTMYLDHAVAPIMQVPHTAGSVGGMPTGAGHSGPVVERQGTDAAVVSIVFVEVDMLPGELF